MVTSNKKLAILPAAQMFRPARARWALASWQEGELGPPDPSAAQWVLLSFHVHPPTHPHSHTHDLHLNPTLTLLLIR